MTGAPTPDRLTGAAQPSETARNDQAGSPHRRSEAEHRPRHPATTIGE